MVRTEREHEKSLMDIDALVAAQVQEMEVVRQKVYNLEQTQIAIKQRYSRPRRNNVYGQLLLTLPCSDTRKTLLGYAMSSRLVEDPHPMWVSVACLRMVHNLTPPLLVMVLATCLVESWQTHLGKVIRV